MRRLKFKFEVIHVRWRRLDGECKWMQTASCSTREWRWKGAADARRPAGSQDLPVARRREDSLMWVRLLRWFTKRLEKRFMRAVMRPWAVQGGTTGEG